MRKFKQQLHSPYSAEDTWEALRTPIWKPLSETIYPHLSVSYIYLDTDTNLLQEDSRTIIRPAAKHHRRQATSMQFPGALSTRVTTLHNNERVDVFTPNQVIEGYMNRQVQPGPGNTSLLVTEGEFSVKGMATLLLTLSRFGGRSPEQLVFAANQRILELTPQILSAHTETQSQRHGLVFNSA